MKNTLLIAALFIVCSFNLWAQAPNQFNYQGIARSATGLPIATANIGMRLTIHDGTSTGTVVYQETHNATTNAFGLYNVAIGAGTVVSGTFNSISWGTGSKFLQIELDPAGGTTYTSVGTNQLLSVPYSLYANSSANVSGTVGMLAKFTTPNAIGNSRLNDSSVGLMYNTATFLSPGNMKFARQP